MSRTIWFALALTVAALLVSPTAVFAQAASLDGTYQVTMMVDDGDVMTPTRISEHYIQNGQVLISGKTIRFVQPISGKVKEMAFLANADASPRTIDLAGNEKIGSRGIYQVDGNSLMICLCSPEENRRPKDFTFHKGSNNIFIALNRTSATTPKATPIPTTPVTPAQKTAADMRRMIVGTWGHQDSERQVVTTLNNDSTFSSVLTYKSGFKKVFVGEVRSSGTWTMDNGVVVFRISGSTDSDRVNQVYSFRIINISDTGVSYTDQEGRSRYEWRVR